MEKNKLTTATKRTGSSAWDSTEIDFSQTDNKRSFTASIKSTNSFPNAKTHCRAETLPLSKNTTTINRYNLK